MCAPGRLLLNKNHKTNKTNHSSPDFFLKIVVLARRCPGCVRWLVPLTCQNPTLTLLSVGARLGFDALRSAFSSASLVALTQTGDP